MNYYERHLGDYARDTAHLSMLEHGAYGLLLDRYYATEKPIPADQVHRLARARSKEERQAVDDVLAEFFTLLDGAWMNARAELEIEKKESKTKAAQENGRNGGRPKKHPVGSENVTQEKPTGLFLGSENVTQQEPTQKLTSNQTPDTSNQLIPIPPDGGCRIEPKTADPDPPPDDVEKIGNGLPDCPYGELLALWQTHLPHLTQPRVWEGNRKTSMRQRWVQAAKPSAYSPKGYATRDEDIAWWRSFFEYITTTTLAAGFESNGRTWTPDLQWVCKQENFQKIIDGKYEK
jgi:uncharacterized protein YdaU (DUF1376 family)